MSESNVGHFVDDHPKTLSAINDPAQLVGYLSDWREMSEEHWRILVAKAAHMNFADQDHRSTVRSSLLGVAQALAENLSGTPEKKPRSERVLWGALRLYASMVDVVDREQLSEFSDAMVEFLLKEDLPRTQQAALLCIEIVFSANRLPAEHHDLTRPLQEEVLKFARSHLDPSPPKSGHDTAIDIGALFALAVLERPELPHLLEKTRETKYDWFYPVAHRRLRALQDKCSWEPVQLDSVLSAR